jgi:hypothetical protein
MQKWEYLYVEVEYSKTVEAYRVRYLNAKEVPDWENGPDNAIFLNQRGAEGWELVESSIVVTVGGGPNTNSRIWLNRYIFKRPKE